MPSPFIDFKGLVPWIVLTCNVVAYSTAHLFGTVWSRDIYGLTMEAGLLGCVAAVPRLITMCCV